MDKTPIPPPFKGHDEGRQAPISEALAAALSNMPPEPFSEALRDVLSFMGEDPDREGLKETPARYWRFLKEQFTKEPINLTTFQNEGADEMITVGPIPFYSLCEHHILPFFGSGIISYIPGKTIVGLSKLPRVLLNFAKGVQNQERITQQTAEYLQEKLQPKGVAVQLTARHMCMEMRGVKTHCSGTTTTNLLGAFKDDPSARAEFLQAAQNLK